MAERPLFVPAPGSRGLVKQVTLRMKWHPGFSISQKRKNVAALHEAAARSGYAPVLEVSTKSEEKIGQRLSAFNLKVCSDELGDMPLEMAFQEARSLNEAGLLMTYTSRRTLGPPSVIPGCVDPVN